MANIGESVTNIGESVANIGEDVANIGEDVANIGERVTNIGERVTNIGEGLEFSFVPVAVVVESVHGWISALDATPYGKATSA